MTRCPIVFVDVFTSRPLFGNPVAVVFDAEELDDATLRRIAAFTNLSETVFVLPPEDTSADYRVRIFTPRNELPFAGHPTLGACHAVRAARGALRARSTLTQACAAGLIPLEIRDDAIFARVPRPSVSKAGVSADAIARALGTRTALDPYVVDCGPRWLTVALPTTADLYGLRRDEGALVSLSRDLGVAGVTAYALDGATPHVRSFAPADGISEDPVCGSGNACVGAHLRVTGRTAQTGTRYVAHQGSALSRDGRVQVALDGDEVFIGGASVTVIEGTLELP